MATDLNRSSRFPIARTAARYTLAAIALMIAVGRPAAAQDVSLTVDGPSAVVGGTPFEVRVQGEDDMIPLPYTVVTARGEQVATGTLSPGETIIADLSVRGGEDLPLRIVTQGADLSVDAVYLPGWTSLLPPLVAILLALVFREVVIALFAGVWLGAFLWTGLNPLTAVLRTVDTFALPALTDESHAAIIVFSLLIGGMVGVMGRNGGTHGIVERLAPYATTPRRGMFAAYLQGLAIFFDDYANTLIVGNTMRPVTDRLKVSREKLAYIVDSTSAPVASIVFVSTWVGYEISLIDDGLTAAASAVEAQNAVYAAQLRDTSAFNVFIDTIPYRFYPLLALVMVGLVIWSRRDLGPMYAAEKRAALGGGVHRPDASLMTDTTGGAMEPPEGIPARWWNAALPVLVMVAGVLLGLYFNGLGALGEGDHTLRDIFGAANSFDVLLWASLLGSITAIALTLAQRLLSVQDTMDAWLSGIRSMMLAMVILVLAWSLQETTEVLGTAPYLSSILEGNVSPYLLPVLVFAVAAVISFATGTSWGTMAILLPLVIPLGAALSVDAAIGMDGHYTILLGVTSSVLAGSIFGDHCSPISDTTVLSSMASACDHMDHVRTQLPYAFLVAAVGMTLGDIPTAFGMSPWISLALGVLVLWAVLRWFGREVPDETAPELTHEEVEAMA